MSAKSKYDAAYTTLVLMQRGDPNYAAAEADFKAARAAYAVEMEANDAAMRAAVAPPPPPVEYNMPPPRIVVAAAVVPAAAVAQLQLDKQKLEGDLIAARRDADAAVVKEQQASADLLAAQARITVLNNSITSLDADVMRLEQEKAALSSGSGALGAVQANLDKATEEIRKVTLQRDTLQLERDAATNRALASAGEAQRAEAEIQRLRADLAALQQRLAAAQQAETAAAQQLSTTTAQRDTATQQRELADSKLATAEQQLGAARAEVAAGNEARKKTSDELGKLRIDLQTVAAARDQGAARVQSLTTELLQTKNTLNEKTQKCDEDIKELNTRLTAAMQSGTPQKDLADALANAAQLNNQLSSATAELSAAKATRASLEQQLQKQTTEISTLGASIQRLKIELADQKRLAEEGEVARATAESSCDDARISTSRLETLLTQQRLELEAARREVDSLKARLAGMTGTAQPPPPPPPPTTTAPPTTTPPPTTTTLPPPPMTTPPPPPPTTTAPPPPPTTTTTPTTGATSTTTTATISFAGRVVVATGGDIELDWLPTAKDIDSLQYAFSDSTKTKVSVIVAGVISSAADHYSAAAALFKANADEASFDVAAGDASLDGVLQLVASVADVFFKNLGAYSDKAASRYHADPKKENLDNYHSTVAAAWLTLARIVAAALASTAIDLSKVNKVTAHDSLASLIAYLLVRGATGRDYREGKPVKDVTREIKWTKAQENYKEDWFDAKGNTSAEKISEGQRNTIAPWPLLPPLIAALAFLEAANARTALLVDAFVALGAYGATPVTIDKKGEIVYAYSATKFFDRFFDAAKIGTAVAVPSADDKVARALTMAKDIGRKDNVVLVVDDAELKANVDLPALIFGKLISDLVSVVVKAKTNTKSNYDAGVALVAVVYSFFVPYTLKGASGDAEAAASIMQRFGKRPKFPSGNVIKTAALAGLGEQQQTIETEAFNPFRKALSEAITKSPTQAALTAFIRDASTLTDANGKTLFQLIDSRDKQREFTVLVPENDAWLLLRRTVTAGDAAVMRVLKRHVIWSPKAIDFATVSGRGVTYTTLLYDDSPADPDATIYIAGSKGGEDGKQQSLRVRYASHRETQEVHLRKQSSRGETGRFFVIDQPIWLDAPGLAPTVGGYPGVPSSPLPPPPAASQYKDLPIYKNQPALLPPPPPPIATAAAPTVPTAGRLGSALTEIQRETGKLVRKAGIDDTLKAMVAAGKRIVLLLPPAAYVAQLLDAKPSADDLRRIALYHVIEASSLLDAVRRCLTEKRSFILPTASGAALKFSCSEKSGAKRGRLYAGDISEVGSGLVSLSGYAAPLLVFRIMRVLQPRDEMLGAEAVRRQLAALLVATQTYDDVKKSAATANVAILLPPSDQVRAFVAANDEATNRAMAMQHLVRVEDVARAVGACAQTGTPSELPTVGGGAVSVVCDKSPTGADAVSVRRLIGDKAYLIKLDAEAFAVAVWLVPTLLKPRGTTAVAPLAIRQATKAGPDEDADVHTLTDRHNALTARLATAATLADALAAVHEIQATKQAVGDRAIRSAADSTLWDKYHEANRNAVNKNMALDQAERGAVRKALAELYTTAAK